MPSVLPLQPSNGPSAPSPPVKPRACGRRADPPLCLSGAAQPHIARFILSARPVAVVVESAATRGHGAATGSVLPCDDSAARQADADLRRLCQLAAQVAHAHSSGRALAVRTGSSNPLRANLIRQLMGGACPCVPPLPWVMLLLRGRHWLRLRAVRKSK